MGVDAGPTRGHEDVWQSIVPQPRNPFYNVVDPDKERQLAMADRDQRRPVRQVEHGWREAGGEPNIAPSVVQLLQERGFSVRDAIPRVFCVRPGDPMWQWSATFIDIHLRHQLELGRIDAAWAEAVRAELATAGQQAATLLITPMVLEIVAEKRR